MIDMPTAFGREDTELGFSSSHFNQERHFYSQSNFKLNRAAALCEWRQLGVA
jgi:hypothetical protein